LRICLLCYRGNPYCGGQGIYLKYIAEELFRQGHDVHVIVGPPYPNLKKEIKVHYIPNNEYFIKNGKHIINQINPFDIFNPINFYEYLSTRFGCFSEISSFSIRAYLKLCELSKKISFDIIHDNQCLGYGLLLIKNLGIPVIATIHHPLYIDLQTILGKATTFENSIKSIMFYPTLMQKIVSKRLDHVISVSEDSKKQINNYLKVPMEKQTVIYNGLDRHIFRTLDGVKKKKGKIIFVGNVIDGKKGFLYLAKAMKNVGEEISLTVVDGGSPHKKGIYKHLKKFGIEDKIEFTGKVTNDELVRHYNESEIAVVPSLYEGFGFPAAEAMSCGVPVISSDGGALPEVVGDAGIIVPARDGFALADALNGLFSNRKKLKEMGKLGIERVKTHFNWQNSVNQMIDVYSKFIRV